MLHLSNKWMQGSVAAIMRQPYKYSCTQNSMCPVSLGSDQSITLIIQCLDPKNIYFSSLEPPFHHQKGCCKGSEPLLRCAAKDMDEPPGMAQAPAYIFGPELDMQIQVWFRIDTCFYRPDRRYHALITFPLPPLLYTPRVSTTRGAFCRIIL